MCTHHEVNPCDASQKQRRYPISVLGGEFRLPNKLVSGRLELEFESSKPYALHLFRGMQMKSWGIHRLRTPRNWYYINWVVNFGFVVKSRSVREHKTTKLLPKYVGPSRYYREMRILPTWWGRMDYPVGNLKFGWKHISGVPVSWVGTQGRRAPSPTYQDRYSVWEEEHVGQNSWLERLVGRNISPPKATGLDYSANSRQGVAEVDTPLIRGTDNTTIQLRESHLPKRDRVKGNGKCMLSWGRCSYTSHRYGFTYSNRCCAIIE